MPPKKQKQAPRNAFYYFMVEFKNTQGRNFNSMKEVADAAGPHWNRMSKEQKLPYEQQALYEKNNLKPGKYTSDGVEIEVLEQREMQEKERIENMKKYINEKLRFAAADRSIQEKIFYLVHINTFCYCESEKRHYPAEIAIAGFNLIDGVLPENVFHHIIKPGLLPLGYTADAKKFSTETHQIPPPMADETENNIEAVFNDMQQFLRNRIPRSRNKMVLYCSEPYMKVVQEVLDTWCDDYDSPVEFDVFNLQYMFRVLKNSVAGNVVWPTDTFAVREIEKDVNAYAKGIACYYHETTNVPVYCSRSIVVRYAYTICDNCCAYLRIQLIPMQHVPVTAVVPSSRPSSAASKRSVKSSKSYADSSSSYRDDDSESVISLSSNKSDWEYQSITSEYTSEASIINDEADFPSLGKGKRNNATSKNWFTPNDTSSVYSLSSNRSYAGATGTAGLSKRPSDMPSSVMDRMDKISLDSSGSSCYSQNKNKVLGQSFGKTEDDFPVLGRSGNLQMKGRGVRRPNK